MVNINNIINKEVKYYEIFKSSEYKIYYNKREELRKDYLNKCYNTNNTKYIKYI